MSFQSEVAALAQSTEQSAEETRDYLAIGGVVMFGAGIELSFSGIGRAVAGVGMVLLAGAGIAEVGRRIFHASTAGSVYEAKPEQ